MYTYVRAEKMKAFTDKVPPHNIPHYFIKSTTFSLKQAGYKLERKNMYVSEQLTISVNNIQCIN